MNDTETEKAAKEYAETWKITAIQEFGFSQRRLPDDVIKDFITRLQNAFLAGAAYERKKTLRWVLENVLSDCMDMMSDEYKAIKRRIKKELGDE
jgi:hypothetical protein